MVSQWDKEIGGDENSATFSWNEGTRGTIWCGTDVYLFPDPREKAVQEMVPLILDTLLVKYPNIAWSHLSLSSAPSFGSLPYAYSKSNQIFLH